MFNKKRKDFTARVNNSGIEFSIKKGKNLLTAALEENIQWPHKCRVGSCGSCKYKLIKGKISPDIDLTSEIEIGGEPVSVSIPLTVGFFWPQS